MTQLRVYGNPHSGALDTSCTPVSPTPPTAIAPIQVRRWARNGKAPDSTLINRVREAANFAALYRSKQVWGGIGYDGYNCPGGTGVVWRFAMHSGPYTHALYSKGVTYAPISAATQAKSTLSVYSDAAMTVLVGSADFLYGAQPASTAGHVGWRMSRVISAWLDGVSPDTDYYCTISTSGNGKVASVAVFDMQSLSETTAGYLGVNLTMHSPVVYSDRQQPHTILKNIWKRGGAQVFNWSTANNTSSVGGYQREDSNGGVGTNKYNTSTSTTLTNLIDRTSTTVSATTPGFYADMTYKDRISQSSGVPCVMKVWGYNPTSPGGDGTVVLKNSAGTTIATVTGFGTTAAWVSTTFNMPATLDKYDLQFKTNNSGARFFVGAVSIWEQE